MGFSVSGYKPPELGRKLTLGLGLGLGLSSSFSLSRLGLRPPASRCLGCPCHPYWTQAQPPQPLQPPQHH